MTQWQSHEAFGELAQGTVHVWLNYMNIHQAKLKHLYPLLSDAEKARSEQFKFFKHRKHFIASHGFLHAVLANYLDTEAATIEFDYGDNGKPSIISEQNTRDIKFNLSHSGNLAILAVSNSFDVGIDIECIERKTDWRGISQRFFTHREQAEITRLTEDQQKAAFYQVWTRKEARMKVTGDGLKLPPGQFEVSVPPQSAAYLGRVDGSEDSNYPMLDIVMPPMYTDYYACLATSKEFEKAEFFIQP